MRLFILILVTGCVSVKIDVHLQVAHVSRFD